MNAGRGLVQHSQTDVYKKAFTSKTTTKIDNYAILRDLGIGVQFFENKRDIEMQKGTTLATAVKKGLSEEKKDKFIDQLEEMQDILRNNGLAHCDIKPQNIIIDRDGNLKLIDNDDVKNFGDMREVCTRGINGNGQRERCGPETDEMGFDYCIRLLS